ncbi:cytochrome c family protein [Hydrogenimonas sp.]|nr:cytochrome c family protein [Hydrogenimonas sp.]
MQKKIIAELLLIILLFASYSTAIYASEVVKEQSDTAVSPDILSIIQPFDKGVYEEEYIDVSIGIDLDRVDTIKLYSSENERAVIRTEEDRDVYHYLFRFSFGEHSIRAEAFKDGKLVAKRKVKIFRRAFLSKYYRVVPPGFEKKFFHNEKNEKRCDLCHDMSVNEEPGVAFYDISESNCFECHQSLLYKKYAHAPTVNFICLPCHNGKTGVKNRKYSGRSKFLYPDPIGDTCFKCHKKNNKKWNSKRYIHDPVGAGKCNLCHNPHSSDVNKNFLREKVWALCTSCHADKSSKRKYIEIFKKKYLQGEKIDRKFAEGSFVCITCHDPHSSDRPYLLREKYRGIENVCITLSEGGG